MLSLWFYGECIELFSVYPKRRNLALNFDTYIHINLGFLMHTHALRDRTVKMYALEQNIMFFFLVILPTNLQTNA